MLIAGIDLGTTNSSIATVNPETGAVASLAIEQIAGPNLVVKALTLPSFFYLPHQSDGDPSAFLLPQQKAGIRGVVRYGPDPAQGADHLLAIPA